jgi:hypothetical protein
MTFIIGWKYGGTVYLAADTAITITSPSSRAESTTSFGEAPMAAPTHTVHEGVLKILDLGDAALALSGDYNLGVAFCEAFLSAFQDSHDIERAVRRASMSVGPFSETRRLRVMIAVPMSPEPALVAFDPLDQNPIRQLAENQHGYFLAGSVGEEFFDVARAALTETVRMLPPTESDRILVSALAVLQSIGIHHYLLPRGVGGAFCGIKVNGQGINWQPDIAYFLHQSLDPQGEIVFAVARDRAFYAHSTKSGSEAIFINTIATPNPAQWLEVNRAACGQVGHDGRFDYFVLLDTASWNVVVIEMLQRTATKYFRIVVEEDSPSRLVLRTEWTTPVTQAAQSTVEAKDGRLMSFRLFPFEHEGTNGQTILVP